MALVSLNPQIYVPNGIEYKGQRIATLERRTPELGNRGAKSEVVLQHCDADVLCELCRELRSDDAFGPYHGGRPGGVERYYKIIHRFEAGRG
ncbi:MAG: hypothetical protein LAO76_26935 [Acidobacteriia bacterium]|nr:hypothetical protein [Terriglobia bacterium]